MPGETKSWKEWSSNTSLYQLKNPVKSESGVSAELVSTLLDEEKLSEPYIIRFNEPASVIEARAERNKKKYHDCQKMIIRDGKIKKLNLDNLRFSATNQKDGSSFLVLKSNPKIPWHGQDRHDRKELSVIFGSTVSMPSALIGNDSNALQNESDHLISKRMVQDKAPTDEARENIFNLAVVYELNPEQSRQLFQIRGLLCSGKNIYKRQWPHFLFAAWEDLGLSTEDYFDILVRFDRYRKSSETDALNEHEYDGTMTTAVNNLYGEMVKRCRKIQSDCPDSWHESVREEIFRTLKPISGILVGTSFGTRMFIHEKIKELLSDRNPENSKLITLDSNRHGENPFIQNLQKFYPIEVWRKFGGSTGYIDTNYINQHYIQTEYNAKKEKLKTICKSLPFSQNLLEYLENSDWKELKKILSDQDKLISDIEKEEEILNQIDHHLLKKSLYSASREDFIKNIMALYETAEKTIPRRELDLLLEKHHFAPLNFDVTFDRILIDSYDYLEYNPDEEASVASLFVKGLQEENEAYHCEL